MLDYAILVKGIILLLFFLITFLVPFYLFLDGIRYFKYGKIYALGQAAYISNYKTNQLYLFCLGSSGSQRHRTLL